MTTVRFMPSIALVVALTVAACSPAPEESTTQAPVSQPGAADPRAAVEGMLDALEAGDFERAAALTVDDQMLAIAVTGNVPTDALQGVLDTGGADIGANYWESFATNVQSFLGVGPGAVTTGAVDDVEVAGVRFATVELQVPVDAARRRFVVQQGDGWKVDVVATFGPALAQRLGKAADGFRSDPSAADILASLVRQRPSLEVALAAPGLDAETTQVIRTALVALGG
jgi:hypothetical protein